METKNLAIDALRLPLIILVVSIHMNPTLGNFCLFFNKEEEDLSFV